MTGIQAQNVTTSTNVVIEHTIIRMGYPIRVMIKPTKMNLKIQHSIQLNIRLTFLPNKPKSGVY